MGRPSFYIYSAVAWIWVLFAPGGSVAVSADEELSVEARRLSICGPRCVQTILRHYGQDADLIELIREMQQGVVERLSSVQDIQDALQRRGIYALALKTGFLEFPEWPHPVILHYADGHFVVLEEAKGGYARITDGGGMVATWEAIPSVMRRQSGVVVLTADSAFNRDDVGFLKWPRVLAALCFVGVGGVGLFVRYRPICHSLYRHFLRGDIP